MAETTLNTVPETDRTPVQRARESETGWTLTEGQFRDAWALAGMIEGTIRQSGSFRDRLIDFAHAWARAEKFDAVKGEMIIRDIFEARHGMAMNALRERLKAREEEVRENRGPEPLKHARAALDAIPAGNTKPFYKAYDDAGLSLARQLDITVTGAKLLIKQDYAAAENRDFYAEGKRLEAEHHLPKREAADARHEAHRAQSRPRTPEY